MSMKIEKPVKSIKSTSSIVSSLVSSDSSQICPKSHPIIAHDGRSLVLCKDCVQGVCAKFRTSNVEVCCQNSDDICGPGSQVLTDGMVPRDCDKKACGKGPNCQDPDSRPLMENGLPYMCLRLGDPCLRAGYTCQESDIDDVFVCCSVQATQLNRILPPQIPVIPKTTTEEPTEEIIAQPSCPFSYMPSKNDHQEVQRCLTLFSLE
ncbi:hypothetical protein CRE_20633 [Caenorhabditis remanei]|uniref:Uncharacterized protein n=1 Tax=Caenorhabditis remanei TaxID=31234 RepID=E3NS97_CAERE|nr:hypothetical protein CRE_20633 [Caenorhabditis remanei]